MTENNMLTGMIRAAMGEAWTDAEEYAHAPEFIIKRLSAAGLLVSPPTGDESETLRDEFKSYLGDETYLCSRDHSAWGHGTMGLDDFSLAADDEDFIESLVKIATGARLAGRAARSINEGERSE